MGAAAGFKLEPTRWALWLCCLPRSRDVAERQRYVVLGSTSGFFAETPEESGGFTTAAFAKMRRTACVDTQLPTYFFQ